MLVIDFGQLGDVVMSLPALRAIRERYPRARITVIVGRPGAEIIDMSGYADATINIDELTAAGFDKVRLLAENSIEFRGASTLDFNRGLRLDAPLIDVVGDARVALRGATVALGQSAGERQFVADAEAIRRWTLVDTAVSPVLDTRAGKGVLGISARR